MRKLLLFVAVLLCVGIARQSVEGYIPQTHYVWCGATGTGAGTSFTNAYTDLPAPLVRGDTYVVAGSAVCEYGTNRIFDDANSGSTVITIRKASATLDSAVAGYQSSFVSNQAVWDMVANNTGWTFDTVGYYTFDGNPDSNTGTASASCGSTCGFKMKSAKNPFLTTGAVMVTVGRGSVGDCSHVTIRHMEFDNTGSVVGATTGQQLSVLFESVCNADNLLLEHDYIHDIAGSPIAFLTGSPSNVTLQYNLIARDSGNSANHAAGVNFAHTTNLNIAFNTWIDMATFVIAGSNAAGLVSTVNFYGNVVWQQNAVSLSATLGCTDGQVCQFKAFNNTIANATVGNSGNSNASGGAGSTLTQYDNLWWNSAGVACNAGPGTCTSDYNCYESTTGASNPTEAHPCIGTTNYFANSTSGDFTLASQTPSNGFDTTALLAANGLDPAGTTRGVSGIWSRGAFQLDTGVTAPTCTLTASPLVIKLGTSSTLTFTPANTPTSSSIDNGVGVVSNSGATPSVSPTALTTYTATACNAGGCGTCSTTVTIGGVNINAGVKLVDTVMQ